MILQLKTRGGIILAGSFFFLSAGGCQDSDSGNALSIEAVGVVTGQLRLDGNGNGEVDGSDSPLVGWTFRLDQPAGGTVISGTTGEDGTVLLSDVPIGRMMPAVDEIELGDTLIPVPSTLSAFTLAAGEETTVTTIVALPFYTVAGARGLIPDKPIFLEGVALNGFPTATERNLHVYGEGIAIRVLSVDSGSVAAGDSVRVRGRTAVWQGVPILDGLVVYRLAAGVAPSPTVLTTGEAADARGGLLDAGLVRVQNAELLEVTDEGAEGVRLVVNDGTGSLTIRFRAFLNANVGAIDVDAQRLGEASGLLVPVQGTSGLSWELQPRSLQEVTLAPIGN